MSKKNKKERYQEELEERIISLIASLFGKKASEYQNSTVSYLYKYSYTLKRNIVFIILCSSGRISLPKYRSI